MGKAKSEPFDGYCTYCKKYGHRQGDCWTRERDNASGRTAAVEKAERAELATAGSLLRGDQEEYLSDENTRLDLLGRPGTTARIRRYPYRF